MTTNLERIEYELRARGDVVQRGWSEAFKRLTQSSVKRVRRITRGLRKWINV